MLTRATLLLLGAGLTPSCFPCPQARALTAPDAGPIVCVRSTDCPVEAGTLTCTMTQDRLYECIGCEAGVCVRWVPEACR